MLMTNGERTTFDLIWNERKNNVIRGWRIDSLLNIIDKHSSRTPTANEDELRILKAEHELLKKLLRSIKNTVITMKNDEISPRGTLGFTMLCDICEEYKNDFL